MSRSFSLTTFLTLALLCACSTTPEGRSRLSLVSQERMARNGTRAFQRIKNRNVLVRDENEIKYLHCIIDSLTSGEAASEGGWEVALLRNDQPNAFALPGKKIAVNSGLLRVTVNQDQLAAVIAHEIAHIQAGHGAESTSQQVVLEGLSLASSIADRGRSSSVPLSGGLRLGLLYPMSRVQEEEADMMGLELMAKAGFNPHEALQFWRNMQVYSDSSSDSFFSTHPSFQTRMAKLEQRIASRSWTAEKNNTERTRSKCETNL